MPQMVIWPYMAVTLVEGGAFVKAVARLSPARHARRQKRWCACGKARFLLVTSRNRTG
jgi:hypothetical protein